jgi:23S rRNA (cytidine2498-2'-O)-methyltransferase
MPAAGLQTALTAGDDATLHGGINFLQLRVSSFTSGYLFALTNSGSERALKHEVAAERPDWRPGFQARGFLSFKSGAEDRPFTARDLRFDAAFARRLCLFAGKATTLDGARQCLDAAAPGVAPLHLVRYAEGRPVSVTAEDVPLPLPGRALGTVVEFAPDNFWAGLHWHGPLLSPWPAGCSGVTLPEDAPSRAWLKLEEAARFFGLTFHSRDVVVELGCAPGGVILALLRRGVSVIGVDPARLAPLVKEHALPEVPPPVNARRAPWVVHCRKPAALVSKRDLAGQATWFMSDMNQSPAVAIRECARFTKMCPSIRSALITLKLTDFAEAVDKPVWIRAMQDMGFRTVRLQQLCVHHRELALLGLDRQDETALRR